MHPQACPHKRQCLARDTLERDPASCWPRPRAPAASAPGQRAGRFRSAIEDPERRRPAHQKPAQCGAHFNILGGAGKNLTFLTIHSESAGAPLFMRVSDVSENLTFS